jgi:hypothetical protein
MADSRPISSIRLRAPQRSSQLTSKRLSPHTRPAPNEQPTKPSCPLSITPQHCLHPHPSVDPHVPCRLPAKQALSSIRHRAPCSHPSNHHPHTPRHIAANTYTQQALSSFPASRPNYHLRISNIDHPHMLCRLPTASLLPVHISERRQRPIAPPSRDSSYTSNVLTTYDTCSRRYPPTRSLC